MLGGVDRRHLDGGDRRHTLRDGNPHSPVDMSLVDQRLGVQVVGAEDEVARIQAQLGDGAHLRSHIVPGRAVAQHGLHALAQARHGIFQAGAFVVIFRAARHVAVERQAQVGRGIMTANHLARPRAWRHLGMHLLVAQKDTGEIHHLAQADDARPGHGLGHFCRADARPGRLQPRRGGHAGGHLHPHVDRLDGGLIHHQAHTLQPKHVGDLVRIDEHAGGAMRDRPRAQTRSPSACPIRRACAHPADPATR